MNKLIRFSLALFTCSCFSFNIVNKQNEFKIDGYVFIPPGNFDKFDEQSAGQGFYMSATEISNKQYRVFLNDLKQSGQIEKYKTAMFDSLQWNFLSGYNDPYMMYYHNHPAYDNLPVVNISFEGAQLYCEWLEQKYRDRKIEVKVKLPTEKEWIYAASAGHSDYIYAWKGNSVKNKKEMDLCNYKNKLSQGLSSLYMSPVRSYQKNEFGLFNMCGNVAEMLNETGKHKGGCWWSDETSVQIKAVDEFDGIHTASPYIGFRPVIIIEQE